MTKEPFIAHSEMSNEIYIICGREKYPVTEQVIKAMQGTGRLAQPTSEDCVSRQAVIDYIKTSEADLWHKPENEEVIEDIQALPPVTPTHGMCKDCKHNKMSHNSITLCYTECDLGHRFELREPSTFYCADFEMRGNKNGKK